VAGKSDDTQGENQEKPAYLEDPYHWLSAPATYCDYFVVDAWVPPGIIRIALGETANVGHPPFFRVGIAIPVEDAKELAETLLKAIRGAEAEKVPTKPAPKT
jgi:hypothetical protein